MISCICLFVYSWCPWLERHSVRAGMLSFLMVTHPSVCGAGRVSGTYRHSNVQDKGIFGTLINLYSLAAASCHLFAGMNLLFFSQPVSIFLLCSLLLFPPSYPHLIIGRSLQNQRGGWAAGWVWTLKLQVAMQWAGEGARELTLPLQH